MSDRIQEASEESFPASDPPGWNPLHIGPPSNEPSGQNLRGGMMPVSDFQKRKEEEMTPIPISGSGDGQVAEAPLENEVGPAPTPFDALMNDHRLIEQWLDILEDTIQRGEVDKALNRTSAMEALNFFRDFADGLHHFREEQYLLPLLAEAGMGSECGPVAVIRREHELGRQYIEGMTLSVDAAATGDSVALSWFARHARSYARLVREHIEKEEHCLFPAAQGHLDEKGMTRLVDDFAQAKGQPSDKSRQHYQDMAFRHLATLGKPDHAASATADRVRRLHQTVVMSRSGGSLQDLNLAAAERWLSSLAGIGLVLWGLTWATSGGWIPIILGLFLLYRGVRGSCPLYHLLGIRILAEKHSPHASVRSGSGIKVEKKIIIKCSPERLYHFCRRVEHLPQFVGNLKTVRRLDHLHSRWRARGPLGLGLGWNAEIITENEPEVIGWRSMPGSQVRMAGSVHFNYAPDGQGTEMRLVLKYDPPGGRWGAAMARLLGMDPVQIIDEDLRRLKQIMESEERVIPPATKNGSGQRKE